MKWRPANTIRDVGREFVLTIIIRKDNHLAPARYYPWDGSVRLLEAEHIFIDEFDSFVTLDDLIKDDDPKQLVYFEVK